MKSLANDDVGVQRRWHLPMILLAIAVLTPIFTSCSGSNKVHLAEEAVNQFHSQMDSERYREIYQGADVSFHNKSEPEFVAFVESIHKKLGPITRVTLQSSQVGWFAGQGEVVTLFYRTQFANGNAGEKFIWHFDQNRAILHGYYITSDALVTQ
jgi:hypothetical protein